MGKVVGVNSFVRRNADGLNYAISVRDVKKFLATKEDRIVLRKSESNVKCKPRKK